MGNSRLVLILLCVGLITVCMAGCGAGSAGDSSGENVVADETAAADTAVQTNDENAGNTVVQTGDENTGVHSAAEEQNDPELSVSGETEEVLLKGLGLSILGDSISTFDGWIPAGYAVFFPLDGNVTNVSQTWWMQLLKDTEMELCSNSSSSGSTCVGDSFSIDDPKYGCGGYRISSLAGKQGTMPDIIIVYMGTNDMLMGIPLGDNDGTKLVEEGVIENFSDAYCLILDKLASEYPVAEIYCCTLLPVGDWGVDEPFVNFTNGIGLTSEDYSNRIQTIAGNKGVSVIDLYHCGVGIDNLDVMTSDGVHPTPEGMKCIEQAVLNAVKGSGDK